MSTPDHGLVCVCSVVDSPSFSWYQLFSSERKLRLVYCLVVGGVSLPEREKELGRGAEFFEPLGREGERGTSWAELFRQFGWPNCLGLDLVEVLPKSVAYFPFQTVISGN